MFKVKVKRAFTLAEVLLTLAIIGIVAAMTVPSLLQNVQSMDTVAKLRKAQSTLQGAVKMYMAQNAITDLGSANIIPSIHFLNEWNAFKPYFNISKDCGIAAGQGCFPIGVEYKTLNGDYGMILDNQSVPKVVLADGTSLFFGAYSNDCSLDSSTDGTGPLSTTCGEFWIDINGVKSPNINGLDLFFFRIAKNGIVYPSGSLNDKFSGCNRTGSPLTDGHGAGCTAKVLQEGKMNY